MGQYYHPIALGKKANSVKAWWLAHDYDNGLKLMEHSYIGNHLCNAVERYLIDNPTRIVWAGDYADDEKGIEKNLYHIAGDRPSRKRAGDDTSDLPAGLFVVNHTKKEYYARDEVKGYMVSGWNNERWEMKINPLALMTCEGNERGGGDYHPRERDTTELVGTWARDLIEVTAAEPVGYKKIEPYFTEG